jgi:hypothetical protein
MGIIDVLVLIRMGDCQEGYMWSSTHTHTYTHTHTHTHTYTHTRYMSSSMQTARRVSLGDVNIETWLESYSISRANT